MHLIKLDATDSTNDYLKSLRLSADLADFTVVVAKEQRKGKGQMGSKWQSKPGKNLTFSVLKNNLDLPIYESFLLNIGVSMTIYKSLSELHVPDLCIKWPNDILSGNSKICGILIENLLSGNKINSAVMGIGLNVNQQDFNTLHNVTSLKLLLGSTFNLEEVLFRIINNLKSVLSDCQETESGLLRKAYEGVLFRKDKPSTFENSRGKLFTGFIRRVSEEGKLIIEIEDNIIKEFDLKEVKLLY